jgi:hypothetical protein
MMTNSAVRKPEQRISLLPEIKENQCSDRMPLRARLRQSREQAVESVSRLPAV